MMTVIIIEDEVKTGKELKRLIEGLDDTISVIGILNSVKSAIGWFKANPAPDLVFSDIQLGDGLSFTIYRSVEVHAPVIFCTAFDEYAIEAFQANSIDYLLKPIDEDKLQASLEKYKKLKNFFDGKAGGGPFPVNLANQLSNAFKRTILVYLRERIVPVKTGDIAYVHAASGLVNLVTRQAHTYACGYSMEQLESMLDPAQFFRANRQFIVNREVIRDAEHYFNRRLYLKTVCPTPERIIISKVRATDFLKWMEL